ncbi:MAG: response regulator [Nitrospinae bacterium]|nr:response regulator [Nitrospinota bacterium]
MVDDLLDISRLQGGKMIMHTSFASAAVLSARAISGLSAVADKKGVRFVNEIPQNLALYGDVSLLQEVFNNLASNAVKFCKNGDVIRFHSPASDEGAVAITDTGVGINPKLTPDLFKHEVKTSAFGTADEPGTGFGLPLCADIVKAHGGVIDVASEQGKGSTFTIRLPRVRPSILVVDDDRPMRRLTIALLDHLGCVIREATNGAEALEQIKTARPHLILSDIQMPKMDGYGLLSELKKDSSLKDIPVILMTAFGIEERTKAFQLGASDFIAKPVNKDELLPRVRRFIGG